MKINSMYSNRKLSLSELFPKCSICRNLLFIYNVKILPNLVDYIYIAMLVAKKQM